jgi:hypothetical protein
MKHAAHLQGTDKYGMLFDWEKLNYSEKNLP